MQTPVSKQSKLPLYAALLANLAIALVKFIASRISGSSAMLSESIHSAVDCVNSLLLLRGLRRSKRPADHAHPFGHGKELYYYALIVSIMVFALGGGMSFYEGISHLQHPEPLADPLINYIVLGAAIFFESISLYLAVKKFMEVKGAGGFWAEMRRSKDPSLFAIIYEDIAAMAGLLIALMGVVLSDINQTTLYDGIASLLIGAVLCGVAGLMLWETRSLLIGESADSDIVNGIYNEVSADKDVVSLQRPMTMQLAPHDILVALNVQFEAHETVADVAQSIQRLEGKIKEKYPAVCNIFIEVSCISKLCKKAT